MTHIGRQIGRYRILELLGSGGMSVVYKGLDTTLEREVAVKVLHPHLAGKKESRLRLAREARAVARLHHPNILEVFDYSDADRALETLEQEGAEGEAPHEAYLVTEYIRGVTLRAAVEAHPIPLPEIGAMIVHTLASALAQAHRAGIIHRDLKPDNVMVREDGVLKVMDFGIAKVLDRDERMTMTGALVGSPAHMAPEIIEGLEATAGSDVFSLGTILFSLVTGKLPFTASNATATLKRILDGVYEDPRQLSPIVSDPLAEIVATSLARQPADRYLDAEALRDALGDYLTGVGLTHVPDELAAYFRDPLAYAAALRTRLVEVLIARGESLLVEGKKGRALAAINQVLALENSQPRALALLERMNAARTRERRRKLLQRVAIVGGAVVLLAAGTSVLSLRWDVFASSSGDEVSASSGGEAREPSPKPTPEAVLTAIVPPADAATLTSREPDSRPAESKSLTTIQARTPERLAHASIKPARKTAVLPVTLLVRPYGRVQLDELPPSPAMLSRHVVSAAPGRHRIRISCDLCDEVEETIDVVAGGENLFHLPAQPKAASVSFSVEPAEATVRIGGASKSALSSAQSPFVLPAPRGATSFVQEVEAEVSHPGYATEHHVVRLQAGRTTLVSLRLRPDGTARSP